MSTPPGLNIVHAAKRYVVIDKPCGLLSVPGKGEEKQDCAAARVRAEFPDARGPLVVHRLDMDTSGLLVFALDAEAQRELSAQFEARQVGKAYTAVVEGRPAGEAGLFEAAMRADLANRPVQIVDPLQGRPAVTRWRLLAIEPERARIRLEPVTGRTHQLRVHCANAGHPILGDVLYGPQPRTAQVATRLMLHANELSFLEPGSRRRVDFNSTVPF